MDTVFCQGQGGRCVAQLHLHEQSFLPIRLHSVGRRRRQVQGAGATDLRLIHIWAKDPPPPTPGSIVELFVISSFL